MDHDLNKELARLSLAIQDGRREFEALKEEKQKYLEERECEATDHVLKALEAARDAVKQTEDYVEIIENLRKEAEGVVTEISSTKNLLQTERREFQRRTEEATDLLEKKGKELERKMSEMKLEKMKLEGLVESIRSERVMLADEQRKITDDRSKLHAAFQILKEERYGRSKT